MSKAQKTIGKDTKEPRKDIVSISTDKLYIRSDNE